MWVSMLVLRILLSPVSKDVGRVHVWLVFECTVLRLTAGCGGGALEYGGRVLQYGYSMGGMCATVTLPPRYAVACMPAR